MERRSDPTVYRLTERGSEPVPVRAETLARRTRVPGLSRIIGSLRGPRPDSRVCPLCGWTAEQFEKTKLLGCGLCHTVFADLTAEARVPSSPEQVGQP